MTQPTDNDQVIAAELAALGEDEPSEREIGFALDPEPDPQRLDVDVRNVAALIAIGHPAADVDGELLPLAQRRVWKSVADRGAAFLTPREVRSRPAAWRAVIGAVAVAAAVIVVPRLAPPTDAPSASERAAAAAELLEAGAAAKAAVASLKGPRGSERAQEMAKSYAQRLQAQRGAVEAGR